MGYYDLDDILSDATRVPCRFNITIPGLAYLEGNPINHDPVVQTSSSSTSKPNAINKGTRLELPLWLAEFLAVTTIPSPESNNLNDDEDAENPNSQEDVAFIELLPPSYISSQVLNALKSSPVTLQLNTVLKHYYSFIIRWASLFNDEDLVGVIEEVLKARVDEINNFAQVHKNVGGGAGGEFIGGLDEFEKSLFKAGNESVKELRKWMRNEP